MGPTRWPYGKALGFANNFYGRQQSTMGLLTEGDTTPDVTIGDLFYTNNTSNTTITYFDLQDYANRAANYEGKVITLFFLDNSTQLANSGQLFLVGTDNLAGANHSIELMHSRSGWYELRRSLINRSEAQALNVGGTMSVNLNQTRYATFVGTGGATNTISAISGGQVGQAVWINVVSGGANIVITSGQNIFIGNTNAVTLQSNNAYQLLKINSAQWSLSRPNVFV